ncbi:hypothetical protein [Cohnella hongkongensis]|uniref:Uncharacterized protein n=1 Tax=Cohnella hongkongensis TaxID=178337 RepID=A0ABV9FD88_9BACL
MKPVRIPSYLHDVFGETPAKGAMAGILLFGGLLTAALYWRFPDMSDRLPAWRIGLALLLIFDIFAGCIANFTESTSNYYAERKRHRIVFLAVHIHLVLVALLLGTDIGHATGVWVYTIAGAFVVNALIGRSSQRYAAALLLSAGLAALPMLPGMPPYMLIVCSLFMVKVLFGFAVDHEAWAKPKRL